MFELLALLAIVAVGCVVAGAIFVALMAAKFAIKLVLLPFKLLLLPVLAIIVIVKLGVLLAVGAALVGVLVAIIVPIVYGQDVRDWFYRDVPKDQWPKDSR